MATPTASSKIGLRVSADKKVQFAALAAAQGLSESALLSQLIDHVLDSPVAPPDPDSSDFPGGQGPAPTASPCACVRATATWWRRALARGA